MRGIDFLPSPFRLFFFFQYNNLRIHFLVLIHVTPRRDDGGERIDDGVVLRFSTTTLFDWPYLVRLGIRAAEHPQPLSTFQSIV